MKAPRKRRAGSPAPPAARAAPPSPARPLERRRGRGGRGKPVSGALGAALLAAAAALLLAPGEARAEAECGPGSTPNVTCSNAAYSDGIRYITQTLHAGGVSIFRLPGRSAGPTTITAGSSQAVGIALRSNSDPRLEFYVGGATGGTDHVVNIVQGTNSVSGDARNNGIYVRQYRRTASTTMEVRSGVTIGSSTTPMKQHGIFVYLRSEQINLGEGAGGADLTSAATIHAARQGIRVQRANGGTNAGTTITNTGAIHSGVGNAAATGDYFDHPHGIYVLHGGTQLTGSLTVTNSGDITLGGAYTGILLRYWGAGALSLDNSGDIKAVDGQTAKQGIQFNFDYWDNQSAQAVTLTNSGDITASEYGIRLKKLSGGDIALTNSGAITATAEAAQHTGHAIYLAEGVTFGEGRTYAANSGAITVDNRGALRSKNHALYVFTATADDDIELTNSAAVASEDGDGIRLERGVEGDVTVTNSADVSGRWHGVYVGKAARIDFDQTTGTIAGRTGVTLGVSRENAMGDTRSVDDDGNHVPAIDVTWTGGSTARGTAENDQGRFRAATAAQALSFDQESAAVKAVEGTLHYGGAAGIEAHALSWRDAAAQVAKGDDPFAIADNAAQMNLLSTTHADSRRAAILAQFRAALGNDEIAVAAAVFEAIKAGATSLADVTDAEIVTYLQTDNGATRTLLRNILAQGLSDKEKAVLRAVATGDAAALTIALDDADAGFPNDYKAAVQALRERHNIDDVRIAMRTGSIDSRGDGIRAYYATQNDMNGAISVTIAAGVTVTGGAAGVHVANAGPGLEVARKYTPGFAMGDTADELVAAMHGEGADAVVLRNQLVTVAGAVTGGTDAAVRLSGGGGVLVMEGGEVHAAGSSGVGILADGPALVYVDGEVKGGEGGAAAVHLTGGGSVTVGPNGRVQANGAERAIRSDNDAAITLTLVIDRLVPYRDDVNAQVDGSIEGVAEVLLREDRDGVPTGYSYTLGVTADGMMDTTKLPSRPAPLDDCAANGRCRITEGETISDRRTGVYAAVPRFSAEGETRAAADQPLIDVTWTGTFSHAEASNDRGRFAAASAGEALASDRESAAGKAVRWDAPAGIEAHALSWRDVAAQVAKGDDPGEIADAAAQTALVPAGAVATGDDANPYVAAFRAALENDEIAVSSAVLEAIETGATSLDDVMDADIAAYLRTDDAVTRALLRDVLAQGLSDEEKEVLKAVATGDSAGLTTALDDADAGFSDDYKTAVRALLDRYNVGDIRVNMTGGSITTTRGDGIRAWYATPHVNNGGISVTVAEGASVTGARAGVYVANAGTGLMLARKYTFEFSDKDRNRADELVAVTHGEGADAAPLRNQLVTVAGTVIGGTDAAVHLSGGGAVIVEEGGSVLAGDSGVAILVNDPDPALVYLAGEVRGGVGGPAAVHLTGGGGVIVGQKAQVQANGAERVIRSDNDAAAKLTLVTASMYLEDAVAANARVEGSIAGIEEVRYREDDPKGVPTGYGPTLPIVGGDLPGEAALREVFAERPEPGTGPGAPTPAFSCAGAGDGRCRLYEALPSMLLAMNTLPAWTERASAARGANGGWAHVESERGKWEAKKAITAGKLAYDHRRSAGRAGVDFLVGEDGRVGVSMHALEGKAEMSGVGEVELSGMGGGLSATWLFGGLHVDAQAAVTLYDVDVESNGFGKLRKKDVHAAGYGLGVDVGRRTSVGGLLVTPRAGVEWSQVDFAGFRDDYQEFEEGPRVRVSGEGARSLKGRVGVMVESELGMGAASGRLFGSLDVEQELSDETEVKVGRETLKTEVWPTGVRVGLGGEFDVREDVVVRATAGYRTSGSGTSGYGGGLEVRVRF